MKKEARVEFGITITRPWSMEMYAHNEALAEVVRCEVMAQWETACNQCQDELGEEFMSDADWGQATDEMVQIQRAITCYGYSNQSIAEVAEEVERTLEDMPLYQLNELVEELEIKLDTGFIGFN